MSAKYELLGRIVDRCESFIERRFAVALLFSEAFTFTAIEDASVVAQDENGVRLYCQHKVGQSRIDFGFALGKAKLVVELDGHAEHHESKEKVDADNARSIDLTANGWAVVRFSGRRINADALACVHEAYDVIFKMGGGKKTPRKSFRKITTDRSRWPGMQPLPPIEHGPALTPEETVKNANELLLALSGLKDPMDDDFTPSSTSVVRKR